jgi:four helix bundle protein
VQDVQKLLVWQRAHAFALDVDRVLRRAPRGGQVAVKAQLRRSADSIATNIVEGCGAASQREFARYLDISIKSSSETQYHILSARDRGLISQLDYERMSDEIVQIRRMLFALRRKVLNASN